MTKTIDKTVCINTIIIEKIKAYREASSSELKEEIHNLIFPRVAKYIKNKFPNYMQYWKELLQEAGLVIGNFIEESSYDPTKGGSFFAYIKKNVVNRCWQIIFFHIRTFSFSEKAVLKLNSGVKKLRESNPTLPDEELVAMFTKENWPNLKNKTLEQKTRENVELFYAIKAQNIVKNTLEDGHDMFETIPTYEIDYYSARSEVMDICRTAMKLAKLPKSNKYHLTPLESATIVLKCVKALYHEDDKNETLSEQLGIKPSSFSRAFLSACQKIKAYDYSFVKDEN